MFMKYYSPLLHRSKIRVAVLPNPRMQPTGRRGAGRRAGGALRWRR